MAIRVAHIGTGNVGAHALRSLIANPAYELTAVWVSSESKAGKDAAGPTTTTCVTGGHTAITTTPNPALTNPLQGWGLGWGAPVIGLGGGGIWIGI